MAAELYLRFKDLEWYNKHKDDIIRSLLNLNTFVKKNNNEIWLKGLESIENPYYDVRLFIDYKNSIFLEISFRPPTIKLSLKLFFNWLRTETSIIIEDEDGDESVW